MKPWIRWYPAFELDGQKISGCWICWGDAGGCWGKTPSEAYDKHQKHLQVLKNFQGIQGNRLFSNCGGVRWS